MTYFSPMEKVTKQEKFHVKKQHPPSFKSHSSSFSGCLSTSIGIKDEGDQLRNATTPSEQQTSSKIVTKNQLRFIIANEIFNQQWQGRGIILNMQVRNHEQNVESELYNPVVKMIRVVISKPIGKHFGKSKNSNRKRESKKIQQWD